MAKYNEFGEEIPDPTPVEWPVNMKAPPSIQEMIKAAIRSEFSEIAREQGDESFEEADDFEVDDDDELPYSPYEEQEMVPDRPAAVRAPETEVSRESKSVGSKDSEKAGGVGSAGGEGPGGGEPEPGSSQGDRGRASGPAQPAASAEVVKGGKS